MGYNQISGKKIEKINKHDLRLSLSTTRVLKAKNSKYILEYRRITQISYC